ncbi:sulfatase-like hydrolase/transferase [Fusobacterium sp.]|uniref:sulfatase-like hydrolase/transferase n=1 Tax=Fusobacterium sp. TaxID=68766 RepID=UPI002604CF6C|nr:sulfatase-like hydrolase/transferase [Fusobacterium sp.]
MKKNIIFITTDHQRSDTIHMIQSNKEVTPNLNLLSEEGLEFENTYDACPLCVPARTSLATGIFPTKTKVVINDLKNAPKETESLKTIHEFLAESGYKVSHFGMQHITLKPSLGERVKFENFITDDDYEVICKENDMPLFGTPEDRVSVVERHGDIYERRNYTGTNVTVFKYDKDLYRDQFYTNKMFEYLEKENFEEPTAVFLNLWCPHPPLKVLEEYINKFENPTLPKNINIPTKNEPTSRRKGIAAQLAEDHDVEHWKNVWKAYLGMTNYADSIVGKVVKLLKEKNMYDDTMIVFTADHGDHLGQHKMFQKMEMYEQAIKVPLIMKIPNIKSKKIKTNVSHLDVVPTILDFLGIDSKGYEFDGESLKDKIIEDRMEDKYVYSQYSGNQVSVGDLRRCVVGENFKYVWDNENGEELFDLVNDQLEENNLADDENYQEIKLKLKKALKNFLIDKKDWIEM